MAEAREDWSKSTVIQADELGQYVIEQFTDEDSNIHVNAYSVIVKESGFDEDGLARYLSDRFVYFVFPEDHVDEMRSERRSAHRRAEEKAKVKEDYIKDGTLGEFLLFLFTDGFLDIPMISHKIANKQSFEHEVYGADGIFFGEYLDEEKIGIGEAKVQKQFSKALDDAIQSIYRFHSSESATAWEQELNVAPNQLSDNLSKPSQVDKLSEILTEENYADYPVVHPVFMCYETGSIGNLDLSNIGPDEIELAVKRHMDSMDYIRKSREKIAENEAEEVNIAELVFFFLPVGDLDRFRKKVLMKVFPSIEYVIDDVIEKMDEEE